MGKVLSGELSCPCDRSCCPAFDEQKNDSSSNRGRRKGKTLIYWTGVDSSLIGERIKAKLVPKETSVSLLYFHT